MTNLIKSFENTKLQGNSSRNIIAKILLKDIESNPSRSAEYRFLAVLLEVDHLIKPSILN